MVIRELVNLGKSNHINQMITLSVITLSGFRSKNLTITVSLKTDDSIVTININAQQNSTFHKHVGVQKGR